MNNNGILTTTEELMAVNYQEYKTISEPGVYILRLMFRSWYKMGLICYFEDYNDGRKYKLYCFRHIIDGKEIYNPRSSKIDFSQVPDGTNWECEILINKKNNYF